MSGCVVSDLTTFEAASRPPHNTNQNPVLDVYVNVYPLSRE
jgi:hypothetical protein